MRFLLSLGLLWACAAAQPIIPPAPETARPSEKLWRVSLITLAAANALDTRSSWGKCEGNAFIAGGNGRFDGRSAAVKGGLLLGVIWIEHIMGRRNPRLYRFFAIANFSAGGGVAAVAGRNYTIPVPPERVNCLAVR